MDSISLKAYAKVNLSLDVTGKLNNGYHTLRSVMQAVNLYDEVTVITSNMFSDCNDSARESSTCESLNCESSTDNASNNNSVETKIELELLQKASRSLGSAEILKGEGDFAYESEIRNSIGTLASSPEIPIGRDNLACKAAEAMVKKYRPNSTETIEIKLTKNIPVSAGLAGGSTDAAAVILALAFLWKIDVELKDLIVLGKAIGADVPFCLISNARNNAECGLSVDELASSAALAEGIGEILTPINSLSGSLIFVKPYISVSTPVVYSLYDEKEKLVTNRPDNESLVAALNTCDTNQDVNEKINETIINNMVNVLEPIAKSEYAEVSKTLDKLKDALPNSKVFMSGSGPTAVAFFESRADAGKSYDHILNIFSDEAEIFLMDLLK